MKKGKDDHSENMTYVLETTFECTCTLVCYNLLQYKYSSSL